MLASPDGKLVRICVFYDGGYLQCVSDYYKFHHSRGARLSIRGLHKFIESRVANEENTDPRYCHVVESHYFRGRFSAEEAAARGKLEGERAFDDVLMRENVITHYLPRNEQRDEKGIDVMLALEAYELALVKRFNVLVLVACDGDYLPLVRKLNSLGTRVMLLAWDFSYQDDLNRLRETRTSQALIDEVTYPVLMHDIVDNRSSRNDTLVDNLFTDSRESRPDISRPAPQPMARTTPPDVEADRHGSISSINRERYFGIIDDGRQTWLFLSSELEEVTFDQLQEGDLVRFGLQPNPEKSGQQMAARVTLMSGSAEFTDDDDLYDDEDEDEDEGEVEMDEHESSASSTSSP